MKIAERGVLAQRADEAERKFNEVSEVLHTYLFPLCSAPSACFLVLLSYLSHPFLFCTR
jgi:hypothetical protein